MEEQLPEKRTNDGIIGEFIHHLTMAGLSAHTKRLYRGRLEDLARYLERPLLDATPDDLIAWRAQLRVADISVVPYVAGIRRFYGWATAHGKITKNPAVSIPTPRRRRRLPRPIADPDLEYAIGAASGRVRLWLVLAGYAGLRCCEIARLRRENIYPTVSYPYLIVHGKGDKERSVPLSPYVWRELQLYGLGARSGWVFPRLDGRPGHTPAGSVSRLGNEHLHDCGVAETMHQLRHRFGTIAYQTTGALRELQEVMGHDHITSTAGYAAHSNPTAAALVNAVQPRVKGLRAVSGDGP